MTVDHPTGNVTNVYGRTKYFIEEMLKDLSKSDEVSHGPKNSSFEIEYSILSLKKLFG